MFSQNGARTRELIHKYCKDSTCTTDSPQRQADWRLGNRLKIQAESAWAQGGSAGKQQRMNFGLSGKLKTAHFTATEVSHLSNSSCFQESRMLNTPTERHKTGRCWMPSLISLSTVNKEYKRTDQNSIIAKQPSRHGSCLNLNTQEDDQF